MFILLISFAAGRALWLRKKGINAFVFGVTNKSDIMLLPIIIAFFYTLLAGVFAWPIPQILIKHFFISIVADILGILVCAAGLIWFAYTLKSFGNSFRIGIDENTSDKLITKGAFAYSRNPIYSAFIIFFVGIFLLNPNITCVALLIFLTIIIHRQVLREEKFLQKHYGDAYKTYCKRVRRYF